MGKIPPDKIIVRTSQFRRELLEKAYREIQESKKKQPTSLRDFPRDVQDAVCKELAKGALRKHKLKEDKP